MTGRGWAVVAAALVSMTAGWLLGIEDLYLIGTGLLLVLLFGFLYTRAFRPVVTATRRVLPARVHAGGNSRVELSLTNSATRRSTVLSVRDPFDSGTRWARFLVSPLDPGESARAAYRLPTDRRGVYDLGPLQVGLTDPFGLVTTSIEAAPQTRLTVYPRVVPVAPPPSSHGDDPLAGADHPRGLTGGGEDFYALREYVRGDDLRKVHWPSMARTDELMVRQDEMPWQSRSTILLDTRAAVAPDPALEILVSAAASLVVAAARHDGLQRLITTTGYDSRSLGGTAHVDTILEHLAEMDSGPGQLISALARTRQSRTGGALVVLTTALASGDLDAVAAVRSRFGSVTLVVVERSAWVGSGAGGPGSGPGVGSGVGSSVGPGSWSGSRDAGSGSGAAAGRWSGSRGSGVTTAGGDGPATVAGLTAVRVATPDGFGAAWSSVVGPARVSTGAR
jgi:uncharacterized protein (DUF58 family)